MFILLTVGEAIKIIGFFQIFSIHGNINSWRLIKIKKKKMQNTKT